MGRHCLCDLVCFLGGNLRQCCVALRKVVCSTTVWKSQKSGQQDQTPRHTVPVVKREPEGVAQIVGTSVIEHEEVVHTTNTHEGEPKVASLEAAVKMASWPLSVVRSS